MTMGNELSTWTFLAVLSCGALIGGVAAWILAAWRWTGREAVILAEKNAELSAASARLEAMADAHRVAESAIHESHDQLRAAFSRLSAEALDKNGERFLVAAERVLDHRLESAGVELKHREEGVTGVGEEIRSLIASISDRLRESDAARARSDGELTRFLSFLRESTDRLSGETGRLASALRSGKVQGRWGEMQLRNVIEAAGLTEYCDFVEQTAIDGGARPDVVILLPQGRRFVIDAKVSLGAYLDATEAPNPEAYESKLREHAAALRQHIRSLADRRYPRDVVGALDLTFLFLPTEALLSAAAVVDSDLIRFAQTKKVVLMTPLTLGAFLTLVASGWQEVRLNERAREVSEIGTELYKRLVTFSEHVGKLGRSLNGAVRDFNALTGSLETRVLTKARRLHDLGMRGEGELESCASIENGVRMLSIEDEHETRSP